MGAHSSPASTYALGMWKRLVDVALAAPLLLITSPIILVCLAAVALNSKGHPIFSQTRLGRGQVPFQCYKLRTMVTGTASVPTHEASNASVTQVGHFLRRSKLDELPQLWNVLAGQMSLVGPRPCLPSQAELIECRERLGVFSIRPGITGHAQILGVDMSTPQRLAQLDSDYARTASLPGDMSILLRTVIRK